MYTRSFFSTSPYLQTCMEFATDPDAMDEGKIPTIFEIRVPMMLTNDIGRDLRGISHFPDEKEWLLTYGTKIRISGVEQYNFEYYGEAYRGTKIILEQCPIPNDKFQKLYNI